MNGIAYIDFRGKFNCCKKLYDFIEFNKFKYMAFCNTDNNNNNNNNQLLK